MAIQPYKQTTKSIIMQKYIPIPAVILEENDIADKSPVLIAYGKNHTIAIIMPSGTKLNERSQERISILVNEPLV